MNVIGITRAQEILRRYWRVPAATALAPTLGTEIVPTFDLTDMPPDLEGLAGTIPCQGYGGQAAVAGQYSRVTLNNNTSDRIYVVERLEAWTAVAGSGRICIFPAAGTTGGVVGVRDIRFNQNRPTALIGANSQAAIFSTLGYTVVQFVTANVPVTVYGPWVLPPGQAVSGYGLVMELTSAQNQNINANFWWTERLVSGPNFETAGL